MSISIVQTAFGGPETLQPVETPIPRIDQLGTNEVLVRVAFAGVNTIDVMTRTGGGMAAAGIVSLPYVPGWDMAGTVEAVGEDVTEFAPGQRVFGLLRFPHPGGAYAQYVVARAEDLVATPDTLSDQAAGALPMAAMTAVQAFTDTTSVGPGQRVLITGAGGGVGHLAVQLAHQLGATVVAVARSSKHDWLRELGADQAVDYANEKEMAALPTQPVDVALNLASASAQAALRAVRPGGVLIALGAGAADLRDAANAVNVRFAATHVRAERAWIERVASLARDGGLAPTITGVFDLADASVAHEHLQSGHTQGKIVLRA